MPLVRTDELTRSRFYFVNKIGRVLDPVQHTGRADRAVVVGGNLVTDLNVLQLLLGAVGHQHARLCRHAADHDDATAGHQSLQRAHLHVGPGRLERGVGVGQHRLLGDDVVGDQQVRAVPGHVRTGADRQVLAARRGRPLVRGRLVLGHARLEELLVARAVDQIAHLATEAGRQGLRVRDHHHLVLRVVPEVPGHEQEGDRLRLTEARGHRHRRADLGTVLDLAQHRRQEPVVRAFLEPVVDVPAEVQEVLPPAAGMLEVLCSLQIVQQLPPLGWGQRVHALQQALRGLR